MKTLTLKESIKVTNNFSALRTKKSWNRLEQIIVYALSREIKKELVQVNKDEFNSLNLSDVDVSVINRKINIHRNTLISMGFSKEKFSREIRNIFLSLLDKKIVTSHPDRVSCSDSFAMSNWFNTFLYDKETGITNIEINEYALKILKNFFKYGIVEPSNIVNLKSDYSFNIYILAKLDLDSSKGKNRKYIITLADFRDSFDLNDKYRSINMLKKKVLDLIISNINEYTDISISYNLIKEGKAFTKIEFLFDYKYKEDHQKGSNISKKSYEKVDYIISPVAESEFESILTSWGIRAKKVVEIEESYSIDAINQAVEITKQAIEDKTIKITPAAFFLGTLENKQLQEDVAFEQVQENLQKEQEKNERKALATDYDAIQKFINDNSDEISNYLSIKSGGGSFKLSLNISDELANIACIDIKKFKDFRPKFAVLDQGFFDIKEKREVRPNMYIFLTLIKKYLNTGNI
ncbi:replication initiation protein [Francisella noatunensis]|uniref:Replication initiation protein n=2 Tax=Francisella noatunensis TaxID=657445 RepID=A0A9Q2KY78_9GAMM|nr:replication initiation protein [Francisella noatunensis]MBK2028427.1 replication initiation protein [Francisella noatunensis]MBK2034097.1 replication initiation protein [Francisella noatunensis]MBK2048881.1 replication initiation protein [Francisella noatunensis]MBK2050794.1 replication initiation protein [Francisella noatunensis]MBK2052294.1 replication initiation protein [Francisella noatunensis]